MEISTLFIRNLALNLNLIHSALAAVLLFPDWLYYTIVQIYFFECFMWLAVFNICTFLVALLLGDSSVSWNESTISWNIYLFYKTSDMTDKSYQFLRIQLPEKCINLMVWSQKIEQIKMNFKRLLRIVTFLQFEGTTLGSALYSCTMVNIIIGIFKVENLL